MDLSACVLEAFGKKSDSLQGSQPFNCSTFAKPDLKQATREDAHGDRGNIESNSNV